MSFIPLPARILAGLALVGAIFAGIVWLKAEGRAEGRAEVQAEWNAERLATAETSRLLLRANAKASDALQSKSDLDRGNLHARLHSASLELDESLRRLRERPVRPAESDGGVPANPGSGLDAKGCTGAGLFAQDGEFLAREASRANALRARLTYCEDRYRDAQTMINSLGGAP